MSVVERVDLEAAFLLHAKPYRETSQLLEILSRDHGRVGLVANGSRRPKSRWKSTLRPFQPLRVSWSGRGSLYTLRDAEPAAEPANIRGMPLMSGFYMNELLVVLIQRGDGHPNLFTHYAGALAALAAGEAAEPVLRRFEVSLLAEIGYGLDVDRDVESGQPLVPTHKYEYMIGRGAVPVAESGSGEMIFFGSELLATARGEFDNAAQLKRAKRLLRAILNSNLGGRALKTRAVISSMRL